MAEQTPRITAQYLEQFSHQTVRILGKVRQLRGEQATIDAGGSISVFLNRVRVTLYCLCRVVHGLLTGKGKQDAHLQLNHAVEIIGKVQNDLSVRVMASTDFGPEGSIGTYLIGSSARLFEGSRWLTVLCRFQRVRCRGGCDASVSGDLL